MCRAQTQRNLHEMMPGCLGEQQRQQRHLLAQMRAAADAQSVQHLLTHLPDARNLEGYTHFSNIGTDFLSAIISPSPHLQHIISHFTPHLTSFNNTKTYDYILTSLHNYSPTTPRGSVYVLD